MRRRDRSAGAPAWLFSLPSPSTTKGCPTFARSLRKGGIPPSRPLRDSSGRTKDADGVRIEKSSGTLYWPGPSGPLAETTLTGTINEEYIYFNGARIARVDRPTGTVHDYFSDHLGSASVITDALGNITRQDFYFPYGGELPTTTGSDSNHYKFTGKERDSESGLDMFGARYYGSSLGRFMTPDWSASPEPVPYGDLSNSQTLNLYSYVKNNLTTLTDANGHCWGWIQGVCNFFQRVANEVEGNGWVTNKQLTQIRRNWSLEQVHSEADAQKIENASDKLVNDTYRCWNNAKCSAWYAQQMAAVAGAVGTASQIANGHAWAKHQGEFPGWDRSKFENTVKDTMQSPDEVRQLSNGRTAYWNDKNRWSLFTILRVQTAGQLFDPQMVRLTLTRSLNDKTVSISLWP